MFAGVTFANYPPLVQNKSHGQAQSQRMGESQIYTAGSWAQGRDEIVVVLKCMTGLKGVCYSSTTYYFAFFLSNIAKPIQ